MPDIHLLTGAYALDALDAIERAGFERHLRGCDSCPREVSEFQEAVASLADRVATVPPAGLRERVLADVARTRQVAPQPGRVRRRPALRQLLPAAAAVVLLAGGAGLGEVAWQGHRSAQQAQVAAAASRAQTEELGRLLTDPGRIEVAGTPVKGGGSATVVAAAGRAVLATSSLPTAPVGKAYQVWVVHGQVTRSAGLLPLRDGTGRTLVSNVVDGDQLALSIEPAAGSQQPTTEPVLLVKVA